MKMSFSMWMTKGVGQLRKVDYTWKNAWQKDGRGKLGRPDEDQRDSQRDYSGFEDKHKVVREGNS